MPFDSPEVVQTPLAWGTGKAQLRANGDRQDGLPEDIINPLQRGKTDRQQYMVAPDQEIPKGIFLYMLVVLVTSSTDNVMNIQARITLKVASNMYFFSFLVDVSIQGRVGSILTFFRCYRH